MLKGTDRGFFNEMVKRGKRLNYEEIMHLSPLLKKDYFDFILLKDKEYAQELVRTHTNVADITNGNSDVVWGIEDFMDKWDDVQQ